MKLFQIFHKILNFFHWNFINFFRVNFLLNLIQFPFKYSTYQKSLTYKKWKLYGKLMRKIWFWCSIPSLSLRNVTQFCIYPLAIKYKNMLRKSTWNEIRLRAKLHMMWICLYILSRSDHIVISNLVPLFPQNSYTLTHYIRIILLCEHFWDFISSSCTRIARKMRILIKIALHPHSKTRKFNLDCKKAAATTRIA